jgi:hypothetical protein
VTANYYIHIYLSDNHDIKIWSETLDHLCVVLWAILLTTPLIPSFFKEKEKKKKKKKGKLIQRAQQPASLNGLSLLGWNVRYDFKIAVFAEYRRDIEAAIKSYQSAYSGLLEVLMESADSTKMLVAPWSNQWREVRILLDAISLRVCLQYSTCRFVDCLSNRGCYKNPSINTKSIN